MRVSCHTKIETGFEQVNSLGQTASSICMCILLMLKRMWKHELCVECLTIMACAILAQALLWVPGTQAD